MVAAGVHHLADHAAAAVGNVCPSDLLVGDAAGRAAADELRLADLSGKWWPAGLLSRCEALQANDLRYAFIDRIPRSWFFGKSVVQAIAGALAIKDDRACQAAAVMNVFVTTFDGICDEVPELIPGILPQITDLVNRFPAPGSASPSNGNPVIQLAWAAAVSFESIVNEGLVMSTRAIRDAMVASVQQAFHAQLATLPWMRTRLNGPSVEIPDVRAAVSTGPFRVALLLPLLFSPDSAIPLGQLDSLAVAFGRHFGWIDDLVDLEADLRFNRPNMVSELAKISGAFELSALTADDPLVVTIIGEARRRFQAVRATLIDLGIKTPECERQLAVNTAMWLGTSSSGSGLKPAARPGAADASPGPSRR
ncbi:MAG: hypothetical protein ABSA02_31090 [Trebonia sp.]|jgi:hypothetical protein